MPPGIAALFLQGWRTVDAWPPNAGRLSTNHTSVAREDILSQLEIDDETDVIARLRSAYPRQTDDPSARAQLLILLYAIDDMFARIHPRSLVLRPTDGKVRLPRWLRAAHDTRLGEGFYASDGDLLLVPRGPLARRPRDPGSDGAETLADRFHALAVVNRTFRAQGGRIPLRCVAIPPETAQGVPLGIKTGRERVVGVPLAEAAGEVELSLGVHNGTTLLQGRIAAHVDVPGRFHAAAQAAGESDFLVAPEFMVGEPEADRIRQGMTDGAAVPARLLVLGSGLTNDDREGLHWNEAQIVSGEGRVLWRQRKLWPAVMKRAELARYGLDAADLPHVEEAIAAGHELVVGDVDGLGRVLVLICQDLKLEDATTFIKALQPDWILVPILDHGVAAQRWTHVEATNLAGHSQARFVIVSSISLAYQLDAKSKASCLMLIGPRDSSTPGELQRAWMTGESVGAANMYAAVTWGEGAWKQSSLEVK